MRLSLSILTFLFITIIVNSQERCGFDQVHKQQLLANPVYVQSLESFEKNLSANYHSYQLKSNGSYKIPLVIHVMETKTSMSQITDEQIYAAIQNLNEVYRKVAGTQGDGNGVDLTIEFALAVRDPQGNCTTGITRRDMSSNAKYMAAGVTSNSDGINDATLKTYDVWDQKKYYNIWLVSEIDNNNGGFGTQGYAFFASSHGFSNDGTVILVNAFKDKIDHTLPHELGHALNLYHTFEGDQDGSGNSICPDNSSCTTKGDRVCDTPPHKRSKSDCVAGTNSCDGGSSNENFIHNYMDYSSNSCADMFTSGQKVRMLAALTTTRASFLEENGNLSLKPVSTPTVDFISSSSFVCSGSTVNLKSRTSCVPNSQIGLTVWTDISFKWTLTSGATVLTSTLENPSFQLTTQGTYDATLEVTTTFGKHTLTKPGFIIVSTAPKAACIPKSNNAGNFWNCVTNVTLNTIDNTSSLYDNVAYTDFSCSNSTILEVGKSYDLTVSIRAAGNPEVFEAYIDYNNSGTFEIGEKVHSGSTPVDTVNFIVAPIKTSITIPQNAITNTPLRMRIYGEANTLNTNEKGCLSNLFIGDVEDYAVYIKSTCVAPSITSQPTTPTATCSGTGTQTLSVTATGDNLTYQWRKGGVAISNNTIYSGVTSNTLTLTNATTNEAGSYDVIVTGACSPAATSNAVTVTVTPSVTPSVTITSTDVDNTFCPGTSVIYTANVINGGSSPTFQWKNKGVNIPNENGSTFTTTSLVNNDQISVQLSSNATCKSTTNATSNALTVSVSSFTPSVTISSSDIDYTICSGASVTFTASPLNAGNATIQWKLNGNAISNANATTYTTSSLTNNDYVEVALTSLEACASPSVANSNQITMKVNVIPSAIISSGATTCITDSATILNLTGSNGLAPYEFTYTVNGNTPTKLSSTIGTINTATDNAGMYNYEITKVSDANGCSKNITGQTAMVLLKPLDAPVVSCGTITPTSLTFNWIALSGATSYQIAYSINSGISIDGGSTSDASYSIDSLKSQNSVEITVTPVGTGCFKSTTQFCTTSVNSISDLASIPVSIFPNPTTGKVTFNAIPTGYTELQLADNTGRIVTKKVINHVDMTYDFSEISKGNYLITFLGDNQVAFSKTLIIQ
jgi:hypothetical protein